jgi:hypothetical protein
MMWIWRPVELVLSNWEPIVHPPATEGYDVIWYSYVVLP